MQLPEIISDKIPDFMPEPLITQAVGSTFLYAMWSYHNHFLELKLSWDGHCMWSYRNRQTDQVEVANTRTDVYPVNVHVKYIFDYFKPTPYIYS